MGLVGSVVCGATLRRRTAFRGSEVGLKQQTGGGRKMGAGGGGGGNRLEKNIGASRRFIAVLIASPVLGQCMSRPLVQLDDVHF